jgi:hypothetical protein
MLILAVFKTTLSKYGNAHTKSAAIKVLSGFKNRGIGYFHQQYLAAIALLSAQIIFFN